MTSVPVSPTNEGDKIGQCCSITFCDEGNVLNLHYPNLSYKPPVATKHLKWGYANSEFYFILINLNWFISNYLLINLRSYMVLEATIPDNIDTSLKWTPGSEILVLLFQWETKTKRANKSSNSTIGSARWCKGDSHPAGNSSTSSGLHVREW